MSCDQLGRVWICDVSTTTRPINKYEKGVWTAYGAPSAHLVDVAVNPADPAHIVAWSNALDLLQSKDNGSTWQQWTSHSDPALSKITTSAKDIPWLAKSVNNAGLSIAAADFDPASGKCYIASGLGVFCVASFPDSRSDKFELASQSWGIEQLCVWDIMAPPGGDPITAQLDRSAMRLTDPDVAPSTYGPSLALKDGFNLDYAMSDPAHVVLLCVKQGNFSGYSTDRGQTWNYFPGKDQMSSSPGGSNADSTPDNVIHIPNNNGVAKYTLDGGKTWSPLGIPGLPSQDGTETGWGWLWAHNRKILCADKVRPQTFYAYNYGPKGKPELAGLWRTSDGGQSWTKAKAGTIGEWTTFHAQMRTVPDNAGHLFFTAGLEQEQPLYRSNDGGASWSSVSGFKNVISFNFGKPAPSASYPTIFVSGWFNGDYGIWRSTDNCATWTKIGDYPLESIDLSPSIAGDPNIYGRCYVAFGGSGAAYIDSARL
jgi:photosystem II stability/assembly factor-like uncharacterized protein